MVLWYDLNFPIVVGETTLNLVNLQGFYILTNGYFRLADDLPDPVWKYPFYYMSYISYAFQVSAACLSYLPNLLTSLEQISVTTLCTCGLI